jgi:hypothetical protein
MSLSKQTHNHEEIKKWVEKHEGIPTIIKGTDKKDEGGVLRIHFPSHSEKDDNFEEIDWDRFFEEFDANKLDLVYQEKKADGGESTFHKFVARE